MSTPYAAEESMSDRMTSRMWLLWRGERRCQRSSPTSRAVVTALALACVLVPGCRSRVNTVRAFEGSTDSPLPRTSRHPVGVATRTFEDSARGRQLATVIWYPAVPGTVEDDIGWDGIFPGRGAWNARPASSPRRFPLVILVHGSGGDASNLAWLAEPLASHGYVVASVDHPGDQFGDVSVEGRYAAWRRPRDVSVTLSRLLADPTFGRRIDTRRIGAVGHSAGGLTVLLLAGARIRPADFLAYCSSPRAARDCSFIRGVQPSAIPDLAEGERSYRDGRIRTVVALDPVFGPAAIPGSLRAIRIPVEIIASTTDDIVPVADNAEYYARLIPGAKLSTIPQGGHFVCMQVCNAAGVLVAQEVCVEPNADVDRAEVHREATARIVRFLDRTLGRGPIAHAPDELSRGCLKTSVSQDTVSQ
jgi:predicted dienelactone hydrolase